MSPNVTIPWVEPSTTLLNVLSCGFTFLVVVLFIVIIAVVCFNAMETLPFVLLMGYIGTFIVLLSVEIAAARYELIKKYVINASTEIYLII